MKNCRCIKCVSACKNDAGRLIPADLSKISAYLGIGISDLITNYLIFKKYITRGKEIVIPAPLKFKNFRPLGIPGEIVDKNYEKTSGICIFLKNDLCSIHGSKPFECKSYMGCADTFLGRKYCDEDVERYFNERWAGKPQDLFSSIIKIS